MGAKEDEIKSKLEALSRTQNGDVPYSISSGYSFVDKAEKNAVDQAFSWADAMMYDYQTRKKAVSASL